jgi:MoxR-like ATPase
MEQVQKLNKVLSEIKERFVQKNEIIDLLGICLVAKENAFILGPPGTAKSAIVRALSSHIPDGNNFEYLLTRFTEPNELFGPFDIRKLKEGDLVTNTEGMMPEASLIFLDEIFNANSAILNSLLTALNEKIFRRGKETKKLPALMFVGASNVMPEDETLNALLDRFIIRMKSDYTDPEYLHEVLLAGWKLDNDSVVERTLIQSEEIVTLQKASKNINLSPIRNAYVDLVHSLRNAGIKVSDRRAVKLQNLIAASALISDRMDANISDLWILKHIWDTEEQIEILEAMVTATIEKETSEKAHPQAFFNKSPNPDELLKDFEILENKWSSADVSLEEKNVVKDKLRFVQGRVAWLKNEEQKKFLNDKIDALWAKILHQN